MAKKEKIEEGLETAENPVEGQEPATERKKWVRTQTEEDRNILVAGIAKMKEIGVSEKFAHILEVVADWFGDDKELVAEQRKALVEAFEGSENLKDYLETDEFKAEFAGFYGISKVMPVFNNIKSYYSRREGVSRKKVKYSQVSIDGTVYNVNSEFMKTLVDMPRDERKKMVLEHPDTQKVEVEEF